VADVVIEIDKSLQKDLNRAIQKIKNPKAFLNAVQAEMLVDVKDHFEDQKGPTGATWTQNKPATRAKKLSKTSASSAGRGIKTLIDTGVLFKSVTQKRAPKSNNKIGASLAQIGTKLDYAAVHNFGGTAGRNNSVRMPQREFMYLSKEFNERVANKLYDIIDGSLKI
jgi:phage virion morphogenesis protein